MKNMTKKKKIIILSVMVALLLVTGFVNVALNSSLSNNGGPSTTTSASNANFYTTYRSEREATRTQEVQFYDSIIASATSSATAKEEAEANKMTLISQMEKELVTEGIIKGKGFQDCVITTSSSNINVFVKSQELTKEEVAQISSIVVTQLGVELDKVIIIPSE